MAAPIGSQIINVCILSAHMVHTEASVLHTHGDLHSIAFRSGQRKFSLETFFSQFTSQREQHDEMPETIHIQPK